MYFKYLFAGHYITVVMDMGCETQELFYVENGFHNVIYF